MTALFRDGALSVAVQRSAGAFKNFRQALEDTEHDIDNLENWLEECAIYIPTYVTTSDYNSIGWDKYGTSWRLVYECAEDDPPSTRPLVDTPIKTRLSVRPFLPALVNQIASLLPKVADEEPDSFWDDDPKPKSRYGEPDLEALFASEEEIPF